MQNKELIDKIKTLILDYSTPTLNRDGKPIFELNPDVYDKIDGLLEVQGFDDWLESQPEGTCVQGGGIDKV